MGLPVAYANVLVLGTKLGGQTDEKGRFEIRRVPAGSHSIRVLAMGYDPITQAIQVDAGAEQHLHLVLGSAKKVVGSPRPGPPQFHVSESDSDLVARANCQGGSFEVAGSNQVTIDYQIVPGPAFLTVTILDSLQTPVRAFPRRRMSDGRIIWDGKDERRIPVPEGRYQVRFDMDHGSTSVFLWRRDYPPVPVEPCN